MSAGCPFCTLDRILIAEVPLAVAFADGYPVSPGHTLIVPRRHVETFFGCTAVEQAAIWQLVDQIRLLLTLSHGPAGYNVGFNAGLAAGQTVFHAHVHVIPRYVGDVVDPRGGVRHAVVGRGYYTPTPKP